MNLGSCYDWTIYLADGSTTKIKADLATTTRDAVDFYLDKQRIAHIQAHQLRAVVRDDCLAALYLQP
jgi:hypothetical protein